MLGGDAEGRDMPPGSALVNTLLGRETPRVQTLGEYDSRTFPPDLLELLTRRARVARELLAMDLELVDPDARIRAIPKLRELLRVYPHPLVYETLINAYLDDGRFDEAKGAVFAARQRRFDCLRSEFPEIRAEVADLREWSPEAIDHFDDKDGDSGRRS
jgi:hypothetical protein